MVCPADPSKFLNGAGEWTTGTGGGGITDAPSDGTAYVRKNAGWVAETTVPQSVATSASPTFVTAKLTNLTGGYIPYHVDDVTGMADGPTKANVDSAVSLKHAKNSGGDFLVMQVFS